MQGRIRRPTLRTVVVFVVFVCVVAAFWVENGSGCAAAAVDVDVDVHVADVDDVDADDASPQYVISLTRDPMDVSPAAPHRTVAMTAADGTKYRCVVPTSEARKTRKSSDSGSGATTTGARAKRQGEQREEESEEEEEDYDKNARAVDDYLKPLRHRCFYYSAGDWWTYEVCHELRVEQFHREAQTRTDSISLGLFDEDATAALARTHRDRGLGSFGYTHDAELGGRGGSGGEGAGGAGSGGSMGGRRRHRIGSITAAAASSTRYHAHAFTNGTACRGPELGAQFEEARRSSEVRFVCSEDGSEGISNVDEPATCTYILTFRTPLACKAKDLRPKHPNVARISCAAQPLDIEREDPRREEEDAHLASRAQPTARDEL